MEIYSVYIYTGYHKLRKSRKNSENSIKNNPNRIKLEYVDK